MFNRNSNDQPGPIDENSLEMLREKGLKKFTKVKTTDNITLGEAIQLHIREEATDPDLKLYAAYLEVFGPQLSTRFYVPTIFVANYNPQEGVVTLSVPLKTVQEELWNREQTFIAGHQGKIEALVN